MSEVCYSTIIVSESFRTESVTDFLGTSLLYARVNALVKSTSFFINKKIADKETLQAIELFK